MKQFVFFLFVVLFTACNQQIYYDANGNKLEAPEIQWCIANNYVMLNDIDTLNNKQVVNPEFIQRLIVIQNYSHEYFKENDQRLENAPIYKCYDPLTGNNYLVDKNHNVIPVKE